MARAVIIDSKIANTGSVNSKDYALSKITDIPHNTTITDIIPNTKSAKAKDYSIAKITTVLHFTSLESVLPFRVKFTNIGIEGYGPSNPAPIGIAVIGTSNYIL